MKENVGAADRIIRLIIGIIILSLLFILDGASKYFGLLGIIPIFTAIVKYCSLYTLFGINTCKTK